MGLGWRNDKRWKTRKNSSSNKTRKNSMSNKTRKNSSSNKTRIFSQLLALCEIWNLLMSVTGSEWLSMRPGTGSLFTTKLEWPSALGHNQSRQ
jgi:hypothetical protein